MSYFPVSGGDLTGSFPAPTLNATTVVAGSYGTATQSGQFMVNAKGQLTFATNVALVGGPPSGAAGGNLTGSYPNPTVATLEITNMGVNAGTFGQGVNAVAIGTSAGQTNQATESVAIGHFAGQTSQGTAAIAIGNDAGSSMQGNFGIAVGRSAGQMGQGILAIAVGLNAAAFTQGQYAIAVGSSAGNISQGDYSVAVGAGAGVNSQGTEAIAVGYDAGSTQQGSYAVAVGTGAGQTNQGANAVAIGHLAGAFFQTAGSIAINASGAALSTGTAGFFANPIRSAALGAGTNLLTYISNEVVLNTSKTFVINHPLHPQSKYLVHACLEGPEAGVYYRGNGCIEEDETDATIRLPDYVDAFATDFTVQITPIFNGAVRALNVSDVERGCFKVYGQPGPFSWLVHGLRSYIRTEPNKNEVQLKGQGPYTWLE